jgi:hypothetical protein
MREQPTEGTDIRSSEDTLDKSMLPSVVRPRFRLIHLEGLPSFYCVSNGTNFMSAGI